MSTQRNPKVLIASYLQPELVEEIRKRFPQVEISYRPDLLYHPAYDADHVTKAQRTEDQEREWQTLLGTADILFDFDSTHTTDLPELAPNIKWIQATSAGIGQFVKRMGYTKRTSWVFTTASGVHARPLAEFVIMSMLVFVKDFFLIQKQQSMHAWKRFSGSELSNYTLGIVGLGKVGREIARLAKMFNMRVVGSRRQINSEPIPHVDTLYSPAELPEVLRQSNFLVLACPHTPETEGLIGAKELSILPKNAIVVNISRGAVVNEQALIDALLSGKLAGASLDVFAVEPLPPSSVLWSMPNVIISPHSASTSVNENRKLTELFCENLRRYLSYEPLVNVLDTTRLY